MHFILFVLIGLIAGALAGRVVSGHGYGMLGDLVVGVVGAFLGGWLFAVAFGVVGGGFIVSLLTAFVGAVILLWVIRLVAPGRAENPREEGLRRSAMRMRLALLLAAVFAVSAVSPLAGVAGEKQIRDVKEL